MLFAVAELLVYTSCDVSFKYSIRQWRLSLRDETDVMWLTRTYMPHFTGSIMTPFQDRLGFSCHFVPNLFRYKCTDNYPNILRFNQVIAKIKRYSFLPHSVFRLLHEYNSEVKWYRIYLSPNFPVVFTSVQNSCKEFTKIIFIKINILLFTLITHSNCQCTACYLVPFYALGWLQQSNKFSEVLRAT